MFLPLPSKRVVMQPLLQFALGEDILRLAVAEPGGLGRLGPGRRDDGAAGDVGPGDPVLAVPFPFSATVTTNLPMWPLTLVTSLLRQIVMFRWFCVRYRRLAMK